MKVWFTRDGEGTRAIWGKKPKWDADEEIWGSGCEAKTICDDFDHHQYLTNFLGNKCFGVKKGGIKQLEITIMEV